MNYVVIWTAKHIILNMYGCKQLLATYPGFDRAVSGSNYLFGESVSLIDFIKVRS